MNLSNEERERLRFRAQKLEENFRRLSRICREQAQRQAEDLVNLREALAKLDTHRRKRSRPNE